MVKLKSNNVGILKILLVLLIIIIVSLCILLLLNRNYYVEHVEPFFQQEKNYLHVYNRFHLGDNIFNLMFFKHIDGELKDRNMFIKYGMEKEQIDQLKNFTENTNVELIPLEEKSGESQELWMGNLPGIFKNPLINFDIEMRDMYADFATRNNFTTKIDSMFFKNEDLVPLHNSLPDKYQNVDILVINGQCNSGQCDNDRYKKEWSELCEYLKTKHNKIVTTDKIDGFTCTRENNLTLKDIAAISTRAKYIIGAHTGPLSGCYNDDTKKHVKKWFVVRSVLVTHAEIPNTPVLYPLDVKQHF